MTTRNIHIPLSEELYKTLRAEAVRCKRPATELARVAIKKWLKERRKEDIARSISEYAAQYAGKEDLDKDLEAASIEFLCEDETK